MTIAPHTCDFPQRWPRPLRFQSWDKMLPSRLSTPPLPPLLAASSLSSRPSGLFRRDNDVANISFSPLRIAGSVCARGIRKVVDVVPEGLETMSYSLLRGAEVVPESRGSLTCASRVTSLDRGGEVGSIVRFLLIAIASLTELDRSFVDSSPCLFAISRAPVE